MIPHIPSIPNIDKYIMPAKDPHSTLRQKLKAVTERLIAKINRIALRLSGNSLQEMSNQKLLESFKRHVSQLEEGCGELISDAECFVPTFFDRMMNRAESLTKQTLAAQKVIRKIEGKFGDASLERELKSISKNLDLVAKTIRSTLINKIHQSNSLKVWQILQELCKLEAKVEKELSSNDFRLFKNMTTIEWLTMIIEEKKMIIEEKEKLIALYKIVDPIIREIRFGPCHHIFTPISELQSKFLRLNYLYEKKWSFYEKNKQN